MLGGIFNMFGNKRGMGGSLVGGADVAGGPGAPAQTNVTTGSAYAMKGGGIDVMGTIEQTNKELASTTTNPNSYWSRTGRPGWMNGGM